MRCLPISKARGVPIRPGRQSKAHVEGLSNRENHEKRRGKPSEKKLSPRALLRRPTPLPPRPPPILARIACTNCHHDRRQTGQRPSIRRLDPDEFGFVRGNRHDGFRRVRAASVRLPASFSTRERDTPRAPPGYHRERALARPRALKERAKGKGAAVAGPEPAPVLQYFHFVIPMASGTEASATVAWSLRPGATDRLEKVVEL